MMEIHGNTFKKTAVSPIKVVKNKNHCFQLFLNQTGALVLCTLFLRLRLGTQVKLRAQKVHRGKLNLYSPDCLIL